MASAQYPGKLEYTDVRQYFPRRARVTPVHLEVAAILVPFPIRQKKRKVAARVGGSSACMHQELMETSNNLPKTLLDVNQGTTLL